MSALAPHIPVLLDEVIHALPITPGAEIVDGTFGAGGYSQAILAGGARVYAFDRDPDALKEGADLAGRSEGALRLYSACFSNIQRKVSLPSNVGSPPCQQKTTCLSAWLRAYSAYLL
jgi:16S rRNA (cytosine1402-N4)-methyltransferase